MVGGGGGIGGHGVLGGFGAGDGAGGGNGGLWPDKGTQRPDSLCRRFLVLGFPMKPMSNCPEGESHAVRIP